MPKEEVITQFENEVFEAIYKYGKHDKNICVICDILIQIVSGLTYEYLGEKMGKKYLIDFINQCFQHGKDEDEKQKNC